MSIVPNPVSESLRPFHPKLTTYKCTSAVAQLSASSPRVWINLRSGIFHHEMKRWHGITREGEFLTEYEAVQAGFRAAKR